MKFFNDTTTLEFNGKKYLVEISSVPIANHVTADIKGIDKFILSYHQGRFMTLNAEKMTEEMFEKLTGYLNKHIF